VAKKEKAVEVRKCVMSDMRRIASLFLEFKELLPDSSRTSDMLCRKKIDYMQKAIQAYTVYEQNSVKAGLKLYYPLKKFATIDAFLVFGDADYLLNRNRQVDLRRP